MSTVEKWKVAISGGRFVVVDATGTPITAHHDMRQACEHAKEIARQRGMAVEISANLKIRL